MIKKFILTDDILPPPCSAVPDYWFGRVRCCRLDSDRSWKTAIYLSILRQSILKVF